jgi:hypothetical protein
MQYFNTNKTIFEINTKTNNKCKIHVIEKYKTKIDSSVIYNQKEHFTSVCTLNFKANINNLQEITDNKNSK